MNIQDDQEVRYISTSVLNDFNEMKNRPKLKIKLRKADIVLEVLSWMFLVLMWGFIFAHFQSLPDLIPIHFNGIGKADAFGSRWMIWILPILTTLLCIGLTLLNMFPHTFNYPISITSDNALKHYTHSTRLIRFLKIIVVVIFTYLSYETIAYTVSSSEGLEIWFLPMSMTLIFIPIFWYLIVSLLSK